MPPEFAPSDQNDVVDYVRGLTDYDDTPDQLPSTALETLIDLARLRIYNSVGSKQFYADAGLGQALVATTAILAKERVENYSIASWSVGDQSVTVEGSGTAEQFNDWNDIVLEGLQASDATPSASGGLRNTTSFMTE